ncbi:MAG: hypothetical protein EWV75_09210 [Microcystis wesenbergii Mw_QC_S_20081001_S30D]|uniref:Uncharacterized protein n=1 Tax=Microcystis wesenbergii Mw_QC_S_20081001_S30D TaxID=2486245 RepID=A0A552JNN7_9CHRO|nr:MAG: hypothetical protein EWV75_09210 [Microcystis wesenbergii Mw_QC_S_20081001_S30D]TRV01480.1 MAG: hypothetical protein EWV74_10750 [Microcystis wesenbergii Mw_QC_S_20081001_S30]
MFSFSPYKACFIGKKRVNRHLHNDYLWSGKHKRNYNILYRTGQKIFSINFRIYDKREGKTKNDDLREMVKEVMEWG